MPNWGDVLNEINLEVQKHQMLSAQEGMIAQHALDAVRKKYLRELFSLTGRNVICYYSGWLSKPDLPSDITDEDKNGFMMAVHGMTRMSGLDLMLHTPGGNIASTQSIVHYLHEMFENDIRVIVPQMAMSAGTMIACSAKEILMGKHSNLGPIDPHLRGLPAYGVIEEFTKAFKEIKKDAAKVGVWQPIIGQYRPTFLGQCSNAIAWSNRFVAKQLQTVMFEGKTVAEKKAARKKAKEVVQRLTDYRGNKTHNRHIHYDELRDMGLKITLLEECEGKLQDLVLTVHHCYMHALANTGAFKIIENHMGAAFVKQHLGRVVDGPAQSPRQAQNPFMQ